MSGHYRCFGCGQSRDDDFKDLHKPYLCDECLEKLWEKHCIDIENKRLSSVRTFIKSHDSEYNR